MRTNQGEMLRDVREHRREVDAYLLDIIRKRYPLCSKDGHERY